MHYLHIIIIIIYTYVTECIVCVQGHDPLTFSFQIPFSFLIGWEVYGPNYLKCLNLCAGPAAFNSSATDIVFVTLSVQLRSAQVAGQWRGDTALTLPLFWRRSTVSPVFFGRYPRSSLHSFVPPPPPPTPPPHPVPVPNKPLRFCGRKAKWSGPAASPFPSVPAEAGCLFAVAACVYVFISGQPTLFPGWCN